ncbi:MAG: ATP-binding domain-containing protein [Atopobiaceae bacterium]|nr:ATP-binding domain-containing protein [Atopobiaceae bacterium]
MAESHDEVFAQEQAHLSEVYAKLQAVHDAIVEDLEVNQRMARQDLIDMSEEIRPDFGGADEAMETLAAIETLNAVIDAYNQQHDFTLDKLRRTILLLNQPYFAKVTLQMRPGRPPRDIYIGAAGVTDEHRSPIVVDWRSPVAETYYNQETGRTSYQVDGRTREVELLGRRQFDIRRDVLRAWFDTTVAIEDPLLLKALTSEHSEKLRAITATIQREQNEVVRHEDVPVLLVNGIAGSGKTSVLLQRIAFLFYYERERLRPDQVYLFTPNDVFGRYIDTVLPSLGESNPHTLTWREFVTGLGLADRDPGAATPPERLEELERLTAGLELEQADFRNIQDGDVVLIKASQVKSAVDKFPRVPMGPRRIALAKEELHEKLERKLERLAKDDEVQEEMFALDVEEQLRIFGAPISASDEDEVIADARIYVRDRFDHVHEQIESADWLRIDRIGMRVLGVSALNAVEWIYLKALVTGAGDKDARYVMVDEVQDYTPAQLMVLARHFVNAHFLMLGDENQAIFEGTATFDQMRDIFGRSHGKVSECRLLTSYRSSPEITDLFLRLVPEGTAALADVRRSSVRRAGVEPEMLACDGTDAYLATLRDVATRAADEPGLCALVVETRERAHWLSRQLGDVVTHLHRTDSLPKEGVVLIDLALAKGLEFDHVVVADAQEDAYPDTPLGRRRLYTAISRAMHRVTLVSQGPLTSILG